MTHSLLVLSFQKTNAWRAGVKRSYFVFKCGPEQVNDYAERPRHSDPDPGLVNSVHVVEKPRGNDRDNNQTGRTYTGTQSFSRACHGTQLVGRE